MSFTKREYKHEAEFKAAIEACIAHGFLTAAYIVFSVITLGVLAFVLPTYVNVGALAFAFGWLGFVIAGYFPSQRANKAWIAFNAELQEELQRAQKEGEAVHSRFLKKQADVNEAVAGLKKTLDSNRSLK